MRTPSVPGAGPRPASATERGPGRSPGGAPASAARPDRTHAPGSGHHRGAARPPASTAPAIPAAPHSPWWLPRPGCLRSSYLDHPVPTAPVHRPLVCNRSPPQDGPHSTGVRPRRDPTRSPGPPRGHSRVVRARIVRVRVPDVRPDDQAVSENGANRERDGTQVGTPGLLSRSSTARATGTPASSARVWSPPWDRPTWHTVPRLSRGPMDGRGRWCWSCEPPP
jgi:hypothetical protein